MKPSLQTVVLCFVLVSGVIIHGCGSHVPPASKMDLGEFKGNAYSHKYLGLTMDIPAGWSVQDNAASKELMRQGAKVMSDGNAAQEAALKAAQANTVNLITAFEHPHGSPVPFNPSIIAIADRINHMPGIKSAKDYFYHAKKHIREGNIPFVIDDEETTTTYGNKNFTVMQMQLQTPTLLVKQKYFCTLIKGYALNFIVSYGDDQQLKVLEDSLNTMKFTE